MTLALNVEAPLEYARRHGLHALAVARGGEVLLQEYGGGFEADTPHALYSGTKSFWGVVALYASADGLLEPRRAGRRDDRVVAGRSVETPGYDPDAALADGGLRFRRVGSERTDLRSRARAAAARRARHAIRLRRHPVAGVRCGPRAQTRTPESDAARVPARTHPRSRRRARCELAQPQRRNAASADGRVALRRRLAGVRPLCSCESRAL